MGAAVVASSRSLPRGGVTTTTQHKDRRTTMQRWLSRTSSLFSVRTPANWTSGRWLVEAELPANLVTRRVVGRSLKDGHIIERGFVLATSCADEGRRRGGGPSRRVRGRVDHVWYQP